MFEAVPWCGGCSCCAGGVSAGVCVEIGGAEGHLVSVISEVGVGSETEVGDSDVLEPRGGDKLDEPLESVP